MPDFDDITHNSVSRAVCRHGAVNTLKIEQTMTYTSYSIKVTEEICPKCLHEMGIAWRKRE